MLDYFYQVPQMRQDGTSHQDSDLLDDLNTSMPSLPGLLAPAHSLEERQEGGDTQSRCNDGEGTGRGVTDVLVQVINVGTHGGDHSG